MVNARKGDLGNKLHLSKITSIICVPKEEQVWVPDVEKLSPLKDNYYKSCK